MNAFVRKELISPSDEGAIRWGSVAAGVVIALSVGVLFNLLGASIGFSLFSPNLDALKALSTGSIIWMLASGCISVYCGAWVSSHFSPVESWCAGALYGMLVSGASILMSLIIMALTASYIFSGSLNTLNQVIKISSSVASGGASVAGEALKGIAKASPELKQKYKEMMPDFKAILSKANQKAVSLIDKNTNLSSENMDEAKLKKVKTHIEQLIGKYINSIDKIDSAEAEEDLVKALSEATQQSPEQVRQLLSEWKEMYHEAVEKAKEATAEASIKAAKMVSKISLMNFFILLASMVAGVIGGVQGTRRD